MWLIVTLQFGVDLEKVFKRAHDAHLSFLPDVVYKFFSWKRPMPLVCLSSDGIQEPSVFAYTDILAAAQNQSFQPSPLVQIDGRETEGFLEELSQEIGYATDRDALWNALFFDLSEVSVGKAGVATGLFVGNREASGFYPGAETTYTFANGTTITRKNVATKDPEIYYSNITSGEDMYEELFDAGDLEWKLGTPDAQLINSSTNRSTNPESEDAANQLIAHPTPIISDQGHKISGFFLNDTAYSDVAVLRIRTFTPKVTKDFQDTLEQFLKKAKAAGKQKLIIDLGSNPGGQVVLGYTTFQQLFPHIEPFGAARYRATPMFGEISKIFSSVLEKSNSSTHNSDHRSMRMKPYAYQADVDIENKNIKSWSQKFGPFPHANDLFTATVRNDLRKNPLYTERGYKIMGANRTQPFAAENILLLYNGNCGSTCSTFSELMREQGKVKNIVFGGRPSKTGLIQAVGGTKGPRHYLMRQIRNDVELAYKYATPEQKRWFAAAKIETRLPFARAYGNATVNFKDAIRKGDSSQTALQYRYELADCRLYYTPEMALDVSAAWKAASAARWGGKACVAGGFGNVNRANLGRRAIKTKTLSVPRISEKGLADLHRSLELRTNVAAYQNSLLI
jgi:hypothetical protein